MNVCARPVVRWCRSGFLVEDENEAKNKCRAATCYLEPSIISAGGIVTRKSRKRCAFSVAPTVCGGREAALMCAWVVMDVAEP